MDEGGMVTIIKILTELENKIDLKFSDLESKLSTRIDYLETKIDDINSTSSRVVYDISDVKKEICSIKSKFYDIKRIMRRY